MQRFLHRSVRRQVFRHLLVVVLACSSLPAHATAVRCQISATPEAPSASSDAFARDDVLFSTGVAVQCFDASDSPVAAQVCLSAWRDEVAGTAEFLRDTRTIPYQVSANNVQITPQEKQVWSGTVEAFGKTLTLNYVVRADDFVGFPAGSYFASTTWASHLDMEFCG